MLLLVQYICGTVAFLTQKSKIFELTFGDLVGVVYHSHLTAFMCNVCYSA